MLLFNRKMNIDYKKAYKYFNTSNVTIQHLRYAA